MQTPALYGVCICAENFSHKVQVWSVLQTLILHQLTYINGKLSKKLSIPLDQTTLHKIKQKNRTWGRIRKELADEEEKLQYNRLRNQVRRLTRKSKKLIEKDIAKNSKSNPKAFWKYSQSKLKTRTGIPDLVAEDNDDDPIYTRNNQEKTDVFLRNFSSVFTIEPDGEFMSACCPLRILANSDQVSRLGLFRQSN